VRSLMLMTAGIVQIGALIALRQDDPGVAVVRNMHDRYASTWYRTLSFKQKTTMHAPDGTTTIETWYETARLPGTLRIDRAPLANGKGILVTGDSTFVIDHGLVATRKGAGNPLMPLLFGVYSAPVEQTVATLRGAGYDLAKSHSEQWDGRRTIVVGADSGDLTSAQFWVDADRLYVVRMVGPTRPGSTTIMDARFREYRQLGGGWISPLCEFYFNGVIRQREEYSDIKADPVVDPALFDVEHWTTAKHWAER
jgi:hypothetical protein